MQRACKGRLKFLNHEFMRGKNVIVCASQPKYSYQNQLVEEMAKFRAQKVICNIVSSLKANSTLSRDLRDKPSTKKKLNLNTPKKKTLKRRSFLHQPFQKFPLLGTQFSSEKMTWKLRVIHNSDGWDVHGPFKNWYSSVFRWGSSTLKGRVKSQHGLSRLEVGGGGRPRMSSLLLL